MRGTSETMNKMPSKNAPHTQLSALRIAGDPDADTLTYALTGGNGSNVEAAGDPRGYGVFPGTGKVSRAHITERLPGRPA